MKKLVFGLMLMSGISYASCVGPYCWNEGGAQTPTSTAPLGIKSYTLAEMNSLTPSAAGQLIFVSDGLQSRVCVSSGTGTGAFVVVSATSTAVIGGLIGHCQ